MGRLNGFWMLPNAPSLAVKGAGRVVRPWPHHPSGTLDIPFLYGKITGIGEKSKFLSVKRRTKSEQPKSWGCRA